ncbi:MAG: hypothetical protein ACRCWM_09290 [Sarcina sp.]
MTKNLKQIVLTTTLITSFGSTIALATPTSIESPKDLFSLITKDSTNRIVTLSDQDNNIITYDINNETISFGDSSITLETTVDYINPTSGLTEAEILEMDKQLTYENLVNKNISQANSKTIFNIPSNAPYTTETTLTKSIKEYVGEFAKGLGIFSTATGVLQYTKAIPTMALLDAAAQVAGVSSFVLGEMAGRFKGTWSYSLEKTQKKYQFYTSMQHGYRYAHKKYSIDGKTNSGKSVTTSKNYRSSGSWWTNAKPW